MDTKIVLKLAEKAGAKLFFHKQMGKDSKVVIADNNVSGDGTFFVHEFAFLIEQHLKSG